MENSTRSDDVLDLVISDNAELFVTVCEDLGNSDHTVI